MGLQSLPTELILDILDLCRPDGFESFALTCKDIYTIAQTLLEDHQQCKHGIQRIRKLTESEHFRVGDNRKMFRWLANTPYRLWSDQLRYVKTITVQEREGDFSWSNSDLIGFYAFPRVTPDNWFPRIRAVYSDHPGIQLALNWLAQIYRHRSTQESGHVGGTRDPRCKGLGLLLVEMFWNATTLRIDQRNFNACNCRMVELLSEAVFAAPDFGCLQHIRHIFIERSSSDGAAYIESLFPFSTLSRLESIVVKRPLYRSCRSGISPVSGGKNHTVTMFAALEAPLDPGNLLPVLRMLPNLTSFVWQFSENGSLLFNSSGFIFGMNAKEGIIAEPIGSRCQPAMLLDQLIRAYGHQLKHLAIDVMSNRQDLLSVEDLDTIVHFRQLTSLTHLDIDIRILRPRVERSMIAEKTPIIRGPSVTQVLIACMAPIIHGPCLAQVLPPTIRHLAITVHDSIFSFSLHYSLSELIVDRSTHPHLKIIHVRIRSSGSADLLIAEEAYSSMRELQQDLGRVNITLRWTWFPEHAKITPGLDWEDSSKIFPREYARF